MSLASLELDQGVLEDSDSDRNLLLHGVFCCECVLVELFERLDEDAGPSSRVADDSGTRVPNSNESGVGMFDASVEFLVAVGFCGFQS